VDSALVVRVMSPLRDSTDILAVGRVSVGPNLGPAVSVFIIRGSIYDADYVTLFANRCASFPVLRGTGWAVQIDSSAVAGWNAFMASVHRTPKAPTVEAAKALGALFLSFATGRYLTLPENLGTSASYRGRTRLYPVHVSDLNGTCIEGRCQVDGTWEPVTGVMQRFRVIFQGLSVESAWLVPADTP